LQIVLNTDAEVGDLREQLAFIYGMIYVPYVMKNPAYMPGDLVECEALLVYWSIANGIREVDRV
jgi:hypothetical protein